jgi:glucose-6-phosphate isomerase
VARKPVQLDPSEPRSYTPRTMANYRRRRWRESMTVQLDLNGLLAASVGSDGLAPDELAGLEGELAVVRDGVATRRAAGEMAFAELPYRREDARRVIDAAAGLRTEFDTLVVLGIGGSALGAGALVSALAEEALGLRVVVADSIDPESFGALLGRLDVKRTLFNVVSKSGETAETMAQFLIVRDRLLRELGAVDYKQHLIVTTDAKSGALRQIVNDEGFRDLPIPGGVGGRFSVFTPVGLFPAAAAGIDVDELLAGAVHMDERGKAAEPTNDPALALAAALWLLATRHGKSIVVLMPYCERLASTADWFCQLWAESLGKALDLSGRTVEWGQTPIRALGAADQHSQLQLYAEGPRDKVVVFVRVEDHGAAVDLPTTYQDLESVAYLGGHSLGELLNAEQRASELALAKRGRPSATLVLPAVNAFTLGQVIYLFEMATVAAGALARIDPFGQPGVEEAKRLTYALMGRPGHEARREEIESWLARKDARFIL